MGVADRVWGALTAIVKLEDRVGRQGETLKLQQQRIEDLSYRVIRLETQIQLFTNAALMKRIGRD